MGTESGLRSFRLCKCKTRLTALIEMGYFPSTPLRSRTAFSLELLGFFRCLYHHARPSKDGFATALAAFHREVLRMDLANYKEHMRLCVPFFFRTISMSAEIRATNMIAAGIGPALVLQHNTLAQRCPADFYRVGCPNPDTPWIIGKRHHFFGHQGLLCRTVQCYALLCSAMHCYGLLCKPSIPHCSGLVLY